MRRSSAADYEIAGRGCGVVLDGAAGVGAAGLVCHSVGQEPIDGNPLRGPRCNRYRYPELSEKFSASAQRPVRADPKRDIPPPPPTTGERSPRRSR
jgi:hypothetical protein